MFGVACQDAGTGAQRLGQGGVGFDIGPGRRQGISGGACQRATAAFGQAFAGGTLDEVVDAHRPVRGVAVEFGQAEPVQAL